MKVRIMDNGLSKNKAGPDGPGREVAVADDEGLASVVAEMVGALEALDKRLAALEVRMADAEDRVAEVAPKWEPYKRRRNLADYERVMAQLQGGATLNGAATRLGMPYSNVRYYAKLDPEGPEVRGFRERARLDDLAEEGP